MSQLETTRISYLTVSVGQVSGQGSLDPLAQGPPRGCGQGAGWAVVPSEGTTGEGSTSTLAHVGVGKIQSLVGRGTEAPGSSLMLAVGCLGFLGM